MKKIIVKDLTKIFRKYHDRKLKQILVSKIKGRPLYTEFPVLKDIGFEVGPGECLGVIGHNGAGKSTLLKLLAGVLFPDKGTIELNGKVSTLIELYAGLHDDLTGIENIFLNGAIYGLSKNEIKKRLNDIIAFADLGDFIDVHTRFYSDGMRARLGFSAAIHVNTDILLVDEVLAVGDAEFRRKCYNKISELKKAGVSIVYVSHDLDSVKLICDRCILLENGMIEYGGQPQEAIEHYESIYSTAKSG